MRNNLRLLLVVAILSLAALACQAVTGGGGGNQQVPTPEIVIENTAAPINTEVALSTATLEPENNSNILLQDDFSVSRTKWGTGTDADSAVEYVDDALNLQLFTGDYVVWTFPNETAYENIHMEVTVNTNGSDADAAFGVFCYKQYPIDDSRYYFAVTPNGEYAIAKAALALDDEILTNNNQWAKSDLIKQNAPSYRLGVDCGNGTLTLYVDGQLIDSVSDSTYTNGGIAIFAWSGENVKNVNFSFDDFIMTKLP